VVEQRILDLAMGHAAFDHMGHQTAIDMCKRVADKCAGDYSETNILKVMTAWCGSRPKRRRLGGRSGTNG